MYFTVIMNGKLKNENGPILDRLPHASQSEAYSGISLRSASIWWEIRNFDLVPSDWLNFFLIFFSKMEHRNPQTPSTEKIR